MVPLEAMKKQVNEIIVMHEMNERKDSKLEILVARYTHPRIHSDTCLGMYKYMQTSYIN